MGVYQHHLEEKFLLKYNCNLKQMFARLGSLRVINFDDGTCQGQKTEKLSEINCIICNGLCYNIKGAISLGYCCSLAFCAEVIT